MIKKIIIALLLYILFVYSVQAHPGRTASDGCHYCRTNCDRWGVTWNERHCHGGSTSSSYKTTKTYNSIPNCPSNASYSYTNKSCSCNYGYTPSLNYKSCIKIPKNAHIIANSKTDVWLCDNGYKEIGNQCIYNLNNSTIKNTIKSKKEELSCKNGYEKIGNKCYLTLPNKNNNLNIISNNSESDNSGFGYIITFILGILTYSYFSKKS